MKIHMWEGAKIPLVILGIWCIWIKYYLDISKRPRHRIVYFESICYTA